jgi:hypothetical protein
MYPGPETLKSESDVEQKVILPLLTNARPSGLAYAQSDIVTKLSIRRLQIGKGTARKLYFPDYLVVLAGLPVLVIEAKAVGEPIEFALDEARLYANASTRSRWMRLPRIAAARCMVSSLTVVCFGSSSLSS